MGIAGNHRHIRRPDSHAATQKIHLLLQQRSLPQIHQHRADLHAASAADLVAALAHQTVMGQQQIGAPVPVQIPLNRTRRRIARKHGQKHQRQSDPDHASWPVST